ncbi:hypothetical protein HDV57DRAFT_524172 [Trichoderma longibrachiatum]|uniref:CCHC-type domain-containing protein n=1 Tax=Trichoderma longibrachiatum ATCC 18648 TaxID=983965 RepID=A0A2T4C9S6_TRILO|nr:hypothetical protein M440DRAFT_1372747 [Trichoderma longibrachiatum ATCC 18648]
MAPRQPNPDDFISLLSSEDEAPLTRKRKYSEEDPVGGGGERASKGRAKRARASSASGPSLTGAKRIKAGKVDAIKSADIRESGFGAHGEEKKTGVFSPDTVFLPKAPPIYTINSISLQLPVFSPKREGTWLTRFTEWAQLLCSANRDSPGAGEITPAVIRTAYKQYIDIHSRLKSNKKRAARLVAQQFKDSSLLDLIRAFPPLHNEAAQLTAAVEEAFEESSEATSAGLDIRLDAPRPLALSPQIQFPSSAAAAPDVLTEQSDALYMIDVAPQLVQTTTVRERLLVSQPELLPASQPKHLRQTQQFSIEASMSLQFAVPSGAEALRQQRLYFPSAKDPSNMCLLCGGEGHVADNCTRSCRFCGGNGHWDHCCPSWALYCENCYRPGHLEATCWEVKERHWGVCAYCRSGDHHSSQNCMTLYRSFRPGPDTIKKVNSLPVSCAACGSQKHFHGDCPNFGVFGPRRDHRFHLDNMRQYLDPTSSAGPIVGTAACQKTPKAGGFRVSGRVLASSVDNVQYYSGSDDSDEGLHRHPLTRFHHVPIHHGRHHRLAYPAIEVARQGVVEAVREVAEVVPEAAKMIPLHKVVKLLKMSRFINRKMERVAKASKTAGAAAVNGRNEVAKLVKVDRDIKESQMYTASTLIKETSLAQVNRTVRQKGAKGDNDVVETVQMDAKEAMTGKLHKMVQLIRLIKQVKSAQVNKVIKMAQLSKTVKGNGAKDGDELAEEAHIVRLIRLGDLLQSRTPSTTRYQGLFRNQESNHRRLHQHYAAISRLASA